MRRAVVALTFAICGSTMAAELRPDPAVVRALPAAQLVLVARSGLIEAWDEAAAVRRWSARGVEHPTAIAISNDEQTAAVIDPLHNQARRFATSDGRGQTISTGETPIDALFIGSDLYLLDRDDARLERVASDGGRSDVPTPADPAFVRAASDRLYAYSRATGEIQEFTSTLERRRSLAAQPFASDFAVAGDEGYLVYPRAARIAVVSLSSMTHRGQIAAGAVPVSVAPAGAGNAISARRLLVADPASKRVWEVETTQSAARAFGRGFLRGLLGLGLFSGRTSNYPTGVDRVVRFAGATLAYDSSSGTLYRVMHGRADRLATGIAPTAFTVQGQTLYLWNASTGALLRQPLR